MVAHAEAESVPLNALDPAVASIIRRKAQVSHAVNADTAGSRRLRKSGRECHPPMLLGPRLEYSASSATMSASKSRLIASASGIRKRPMRVGNARVTSSSMGAEPRSAERHGEGESGLAGFLVF